MGQTFLQNLGQGEGRPSFANSGTPQRSYRDVRGALAPSTAKANGRRRPKRNILIPLLKQPDDDISAGLR